MDETPEAPDETDAPSSGRSLLPWQRNAIQLGAVAAVISAILAVTANLSEIMGWFAPDQTREIVVRTQSTVEDTDAKVNELLTLLRNQAAVNGVELDIESEVAMRNAINAIVLSGNREKRSALRMLDQGDVGAAAGMIESVARNQASAVSETSDAAAASWREAGALYYTYDVAKAVDSYQQAARLQPDHGETLDLLGHALVRAGRIDAAVRNFERILALDATPRRQVSALFGLGSIAKQRAEYAAASGLYDRAGTLARSNGLREEEIYVQLLLAQLDLARGYGDYAEADLMMRQALAIHEARNDLANRANALGNLGALALLQGDAAAAEPIIEESVSLGTRLGWQSSVAYDLVNLASIATDLGDFDSADRRLDRAAMIAEAAELEELVPVIAFNRGDVAQARGDPELACTLWIEALGKMIETENPHTDTARETIYEAGCEMR